MSESSSPPDVLPEPPPRPERRESSSLAFRALGPLGLAIALGAVAWNWYDTRRELGAMRDEVAVKLRNTELDGRENRTVARRAEEEARGVASKVGVLEARIVESQGQQVALEQLYQELSRGRDEWTLAEIDQTLAIASQQLQLAGNIQGALAALQTADARLARSDRPQFIPIRRAIAA